MQRELADKKEYFQSPCRVDTDQMGLLCQLPTLLSSRAYYPDYTKNLDEFTEPTFQVVRIDLFVHGKIKVDKSVIK